MLGKPDKSTVLMILLGLLVVVFFIMVTLGIQRKIDRCEAAGGVRVKGTGHGVCIHRDALIEEY